MSAHWEEKRPVRVNANPHPDLIYDFGGFPPELYSKTYPCPGEPEVARHVVKLLGDAGIEAELETQRGIDHGVWTPLSRIFPDHSVPVVEISLPSARTPQMVFDMGRALSKLWRRWGKPLAQAQ